MWQSPYFGEWRADPGPERVHALDQSSYDFEVAYLAELNNDRPQQICTRICPECELAKREEMVQIVKAANETNVTVVLPWPCHGLSRIREVADFDKLLVDPIDYDKKRKWASKCIVMKQIKRANKGTMWARTGSMLKKANHMVQQANTELSNAEQRRMTMETAKKLATSLRDVIRSGGLFNAFRQANKRFQQLSEQSPNLIAASDAYDRSPTDANLEILETEEALFFESDKYQCAEGNTAVLKALDYANCFECDESLRIYDMCQAKTGEKSHCGRYMPSTYWTKSNTRWRFYCCVNWPQAAEFDPSLIEHFEDLGYGPNPETWPGNGSGCGARFSLATGI